MKKRVLTVLFPILALIASIYFSSCEKYVLPSMSITPDTLFFSASGGTQETVLSTNIIWEIKDENIPAWVTVDPKTGDGGCILSVSVSENEQSSERKGDLSVTSEVLEKSVTIIQAGTDQANQ